MDVAEYQNVFSNEESHFFYVSIHELIVGFIQRHLTSVNHPQILDAGCGTGGLALKLAAMGEVVGIDMQPEALNFAKQRGVNCRQGSVESLPFAEGEFDLVTCIDVIYHQKVDNDGRALSELHRVLKPGALLILRVPAQESLFSSHDKLVQTARRYERSQLDKKLRLAGFEIIRLSYCQAALFIPAWIKARLERFVPVSAHSSIGQLPNWLNALVKTVLKTENSLVQGGVSMPMGIGLMAVARKVEVYG